jgi:putative membrane protein
MLKAWIKPNDSIAYRLIAIVSIVVFAAVVALRYDAVKINPGFDAHIFARFNALINFTVSVLLISGYVLVMRRKYKAHRTVMLTSIVLSSLFLLSYIAHHLLAPETHFGGEGPVRYFYYFILITHIFLAAVILPFILITSYRSLSGEFLKHKKIARITFPIWLYVSITGVLVYLFISPYYG